MTRAKNRTLRKKDTSVTGNRTNENSNNGEAVVTKAKDGDKVNDDIRRKS